MAVHQAPPSLGFSRQEHWSGLPFSSPMHKSESEVAQSCPTLCDPLDCSLPGSSVHGVFQARVLEWGAIAFSEFCHIVTGENLYLGSLPSATDINNVSVSAWVGRLMGRWKEEPERGIRTWKASRHFKENKDKSNNERGKERNRNKEWTVMEKV